jgi:hypothetical protein
MREKARNPILPAIEKSAASADPRRPSRGQSGERHERMTDGFCDVAVGKRIAHLRSYAGQRIISPRKPDDSLIRTAINQTDV